MQHMSRIIDYISIFVTGTNGLVTYGGVTEDGFTINPETGVISVTQVLDRELQDHYTVTGISFYIFSIIFYFIFIYLNYF